MGSRGGSGRLQGVLVVGLSVVLVASALGVVAGGAAADAPDWPSTCRDAPALSFGTYEQTVGSEDKDVFLLDVNSGETVYVRMEWSGDADNYRMGDAGFYNDSYGRFSLSGLQERNEEHGTYFGRTDDWWFFDDRRGTEGEGNVVEAELYGQNGDSTRCLSIWTGSKHGTVEFTIRSDTPERETATPTTSAPTTSAPTAPAAVRFDDQTVASDGSGQLVVDAVELPDDGFVVVLGTFDGETRLVGSTSLSAGEHDDVSVAAEREIPGAMQLFAVPVNDENANGELDLNSDPGYQRDGELVIDSAIVSVAESTTARTTARTTTAPPTTEQRTATPSTTVATSTVAETAATPETTEEVAVEEEGSSSGGAPGFGVSSAAVAVAALAVLYAARTD